MKPQKPNQPIEGYFRAKRIQHAKTSWPRIMRENLSQLRLGGDDILRSIALFVMCLCVWPFLIGGVIVVFGILLRINDPTPAVEIFAAIGFLVWGYAATATTNWFGMNKAITIIINKRYADTGLNSLYISDNDLRKVTFRTSYAGFALPIAVMICAAAFASYLGFSATLNAAVLVVSLAAAALVRYGPQNLIPLIMVDEELSYYQARQRMLELTAGRYLKVSLFLAISNLIWLAAHLALFIPGPMLYDWNQNNLVDLYIDLLRRENPDAHTFDIAHHDVIEPGPVITQHS